MMFRSLFLFFVTLVLTLPVFSSANCDNKHSLNELKGTYAYQFSGTFGPSSLSNEIVETGVFKSDGKGHVAAHAVSIINGQPSINVTYKGTYTIDRHIAYVDVTRFTSEGSSNLNFILSIAKKTDSVFIQAQPIPGTDFAFINVIGEGKK